MSNDWATSTNWSGYVATDTQPITVASGQWTVPAIQPSETEQESSSWVGIDGYPSSNQNLIQAGTTELTEDDETDYFAWYEILPADPLAIPITGWTVQPGDRMSSTVYEVSGQWWIDIADTSQSDEVFDQPFSYSGSGLSAEWIEEDPAEYMNGPLYSLANFGTVPFSMTWIQTTNPGSASYIPLDMVEPYSNDVVAYPSDLVESGLYGSFNITYGHQPVPTTTISTDPATARFGQQVTYSAIVSGSGGTPTGTVSFATGATPLCTATLAGGSGSCTATNAPVGTDDVGGAYSGDASFEDSTSNTVTLVVNPAPPPPTPPAPPTPHDGYQEVASDGGIFSFAEPGSQPGFYGSMGGQHLNASIVGIAYDPHDGGYLEVASDGGIFSFAPPGVTPDFFGSMGGGHLNASIVGIAYDPHDGGYLEVASDGGIFSFAPPGVTPDFFGSMGGQHLNASIVGIAYDPHDGGYLEVASDGGIFSFAPPGVTPDFFGSMGGQHLNASIVGIAYDPHDGGYLEVASDGGIFSFAPPGVTPDFFGSMGGQHLNASIVGIAYDPHDGGYLEVASDGGIFSFAPPGVTPDFFGSMGGQHLNASIVGMFTSST